MEIHLNVNFSFRVALSHPAPAKGREIMRMLLEMRNTVNEIVNRLAPFLV
jgi:hypothetical protein